MGTLINPGPHLFWITSRAAGTVALVTASLSVGLGLMMAARMLKGRGQSGDWRVLHESLALATLAALAVHALSLLGDRYMHPSLLDIALPFHWNYRAGWTALGIVGGWMLLLLGVSYYARRRIGAQRWRRLHRWTALAWVFGVFHALGSGSDSGRLWFLALSSVVVLPALWLLAVRYLSENPQRPVRPQPPGRPPVRPEMRPAGELR
jgi:methionine sulfoxide reductase heme-binding subunit